MDNVALKVGSRTAFWYGSYEVVGVYGSYVQHVHVGGINVYIGISG